MRNDDLKLSKRKANRKIEEIAKHINVQYGVDVKITYSQPNAQGCAHDNFDGDLSIDVLFMPRMEKYRLFNHVNDMDFIDAIRALYHEERHLIQNADMYQNQNPSETDVAMAIRHIACKNNRFYYMSHSNYYNDMNEIDAEGAAIVKTYNYIKSEFQNVNADKMMLDYITKKIATSQHYFIDGTYDSFESVIDAFSAKFEKAKDAKLNYEKINTNTVRFYNQYSRQDECVGYLRAYISENHARTDIAE